MKKFCIIGIVMILMLSVFFLSVFAASESIVDDEGWVVYTRLNSVTATYKVNSGQNESYLVKSFSDIPLPFGPRAVTFDSVDPVSNFWVNISFYNVDSENPENSSIVTVPAGESVVISAGLKLSNMYYPSSESYSDVPADLYEARIYLDDNYTRYLEADVSATAAGGAQLYYSFTNNTDKPVSLSRVSLGLFDDSDLESYGFRFYINRIKYRMFTSSQMSTQAIVDEIQNSTDQITGSIGDLGDQIGNDIQNSTDQIGDDIQNSTDQIVNGWDGSSVAPDGSDIVTDVENTEQILVDGAQDGLDNLGVWFSDTTAFLTNFADCFGLIGMLFDRVQYVGEFWILVVISLSIGSFAFLLGVLPSAIRKGK